MNYATYITRNLKKYNFNVLIVKVTRSHGKVLEATFFIFKWFKTRRQTTEKIVLIVAVTSFGKGIKRQILLGKKK